MTASPAKLRSGEWGARVQGSVAVGDTITITTTCQRCGQEVPDGPYDAGRDFPARAGADRCPACGIPSEVDYDAPLESDPPTGEDSEQE